MCMIDAIEWTRLGLFVGGAVLGGLVIFNLAAGYYHLRYYVLRRDAPESWKIQHKRFLTPRLARSAFLLTNFNMILGGLVTGVLIYAMTEGMPTAIYTDVDEYGWPWLVISVPVLFILNDAGAYYVHRALHQKWMFRNIHRHHHRYVATNPYVTVAVHPLELLALQASSFLPLFFIPFHVGVIGAVLIYILVFNVIDHSGVRLVSLLPWQGPSMYHDDHHTQFHCNFGQHLMIWDKIHGTLRRQKRGYGSEVFGGRGKVEGEETEIPDFVHYP